MYIQSFQNAAASKIVVTATATNIFDLINTAGSTNLPNAGFSGASNAIILQPENGDIRILFNNQVPTATNGFKIASGSIANLTNVPLKSLKLIRVSADVTCSVQIGITEMGESSTITSTGSGSSTSVGTYNLVPPTITSGSNSTIQLNSEGDTKVAEQFVDKFVDNTNNVAWMAARPGVTSWTVDKSIGAVTKRNVKASAGYVGGVYVSNRNAALRYFQIHAKATAPAGADVPLYSFEIPINGALVLDGTHFGLSGDAIATGVGWAISTTNATFTDAATVGEHNVYLRWV